MKFAIFTTLFSLALASPLTVTKRDSTTCADLAAPLTDACGVLQSACLSTLTPEFLDIWSVPSCVAAATCGGTTAVLAPAQCAHPELDAATAPQLNFNIYAGMVGACAWDDAGCAVTFQNYVDFLYRTLTELGSNVWPESVDFVRAQWWNPIVEWTATGDELPYMNFNDWLKYSNSLFSS